MYYFWKLWILSCSFRSFPKQDSNLPFSFLVLVIVTANVDSRKKKLGEKGTKLFAFTRNKVSPLPSRLSVSCRHQIRKGTEVYRFSGRSLAIMERLGGSFHKERLSTDTFDFKVDVGFLP